MYAIVATGGKQYKVEKDLIFKVDKLEGEVGSKIKLDVILVSDKEGKITCGNPLVSGAVVECEIVRQDKAKKIVVFKYKPKKNERKRQGHRQPFTALKVTKIKA